MTSGLFPGNEEISAPPPVGSLIGTYLFCENWSTKTFGSKGQKSGLFVRLLVSISKLALDPMIEGNRQERQARI